MTRPRTTSVRLANQVDDPGLTRRLERATHGRGAFRRFKDSVCAPEGEQTLRHLVSTERELGRVRA